MRWQRQGAENLPCGERFRPSSLCGVLDEDGKEPELVREQRVRSRQQVGVVRASDSR